MLELEKLVLAVHKLLLFGSLELEKLLKHLKLFGFFFHLAGLQVVLANLVVSGVDDGGASFLSIVREIFLEFKSEVEHFNLELTYANLHVIRLL